MLYPTMSLLRLSIVSLVVMFLQLSQVLSQDIKIGNQVWSSKNLDVSTFRNGEAIPEAKNAKEWAKAGENKTAAYCYYDYDSKNGKVYGKLYNWYAVNDSRGLAPNGYHIPSDAEWTILTDKFGGELYATAGNYMKSATGWAHSGNGNNSSGFNALPGGGCDGSGGFISVTENGYFWSFSEDSTVDAWYRRLHYSNSECDRGNGFKYGGLSVRCLRD
jgi:uncharacterized protein (TIGR02145 family)